MTGTDQAFQISVGQLLYYWPREQTLSFYDAIATSMADIVYLGETVCCKRNELKASDWELLAQKLKNAGKQVVISARISLESEADARNMRRLRKNRDYLIEAGEPGSLLHLVGRPFVAGPYTNVQNADTMSWLADLGAIRMVVPADMNRDDLTNLLAERCEGMQFETQVWGRVPLTLSSSCLTAKHHCLTSVDCQSRCIEYPDGWVLINDSIDDPIAINGSQTQSVQIVDLLDRINDLTTQGINILRVNPHSIGTLDAIQALHRIRIGQEPGEIPLPEGIERILALNPGLCQATGAIRKSRG